MQRIDANRPANIAKMQIAEIDHVDAEIPVEDIAVELLGHGPRHDDPARRRIGLQTRGNVDPVAIDVVFFQDDVGRIQPHPETDPLIDRKPRGVCGYSRLQRKRTIRRVLRRIKGCEEAVAGVLDNSSVPLRHPRIENFGAQLLELEVGVLLMPLHQPAVSDYVGREDSRKLASHFRHGTALLLPLRAI